MSFRKRISALVNLRNRTRRQNRNSDITRRLLIESMEERRLLTTIDLAALTASEGMTFYGAVAADQSGLSVSDAGDFNGDGFDDILIGARLADAGGSNRGATYLILGGPSLPASLELISFDIAVVGLTNNDFVGRSVSAAGDLNGDGFDDLIVGADGGDGSADTITNAGESYVIFGTNQVSGVLTTSDASVTIYGVNTGDQSGLSVNGAGDVNGDGYDDLIIGALDDTISGGAGSDNMQGGLGDDVYVFGAATSPEADLVTESTNQGSDTLDFASIATTITFSVASAAVQTVHANRTVKLNAGSTLENITGGTGDDILTGNALNNSLLGGNGNDALNGGRGSDALVGGQGDDTYLFTAATTLEADSVSELFGQGKDLLSFSTIATPVTLNLESIAVQSVHTNRTLQINAVDSIEAATGGAGNDSLTGNALNNTLIGGSGNDTLNGGAGSDNLQGGIGDDVYLFDSATAAEADLVTESNNQGSETLNFTAISVPIALNLGILVVQNIHTNRTLKLNAGSTVENAIGGSGDDILHGNALNNVLTGGGGNDILVGQSGADQLFGQAGRDILIGGLDLDLLDGGADDDILIAGRTIGDNSVTKLADMRAEWISANSYAMRRTNLQTGVGTSNASLKAMINVLNDAGEDDTLIGGTEADWFFAALDDVVTDLFAGELVDLL